MAVKHFIFAAFTTGRENVIRSGGGFGESIIGNIHGSVTVTGLWFCGQRSGFRVKGLGFRVRV
jgi:hypothetical protein